MKALVAALAVLLTLLFSTASQAASSARSLDREVWSSSSTLLWLPAHPHAGTARARRRLQDRAYGRLTGALHRSGFLPAALCIKRYEGSWQSVADNGHYGGMQADLGFMRSYGMRFLKRWGTANRWPVWSQLTMGYYGWRDRGWSPWTTAEKCGL